MPIDRHAQTAKLIAEDFYFGSLDLSDREVTPDFDAWANMPEVECVERLRKDGVGQPEIRLFITFIAAMERALDSIRLWNQGVELFTLHPELFDPQRVAKMRVDDLRDLLTKFKVSQRHGPDSSAWFDIANSLLDKTNPVAKAVYHGQGDAQELLDCLQTKCHSKAKFPHLRGPKIGPMWVRTLVAPGGAHIKNMHVVPVAVDVHVKRVTKNLIASRPQDRRSIQQSWHDAVRNTKFTGPDGLSNTCAALDPALWTFGKYGCSHCEAQERPIPISDACDHCSLNSVDMQTG